jgi:hypothetical protein
VKRYGLLVVGLFLLTLPGLAAAQEGFLGTSGSASLGGLTIIPSVGLGWQRMGVNFSSNIPLEIRGPGYLEVSPGDLKFTDANVWIGRVTVEALTGTGVFGFINAEGSAGRNITVSTPIEPENADATDPAIWGGRRLEWWRGEAGGGVLIRDGVYVFGGLRFDHLQVNLRNPQNATNEWADPFFRYRGDFRSKTLVPYVGMRLDGPNYRAALVYGPFAWCNFKVPFRMTTADSDTATSEEALYRFRAPGYLLEGTFDYDVNLSEAVFVSLWGRASMTKFAGSGNFELYQNDTSFAGPASVSKDGKTYYAVYLFTVGVTGKVAF